MNARLRGIMFVWAAPVLLGAFAAVALILAAVGIYGVMSYVASQRTHEIGIRMALGADKMTIVRLVLRGAFKMVAVGLLLGIPLAIGAGRLISSQLYGVAGWDPWSLLSAVGALGLCGFIAAVIPARRASGIEPIDALRT